MNQTQTISPEAQALLREAAYILANNAVDGDETAGKLSQAIHALLSAAPGSFDWKRFLHDRRAAWKGLLEADPDDSLANGEIDEIDRALKALSAPEPDAALGDECLVINLFGGNCPVQAEGRVDGQPFYFRARGSRWSFSVGQEPFLSPEFRYEEPYGATFEAGWMSEDEAIAFLWKAVGLYRKSKANPEQSEGLEKPDAP